MKIYTTYFYNLRFLKPHQIPISTAVWDPKWYHENLGPGHVWKNKEGVWMGIRMDMLTGRYVGAVEICPCQAHNPEECVFLSSYLEGLRKLDFRKVMEYLQEVADFIKKSEGFQEEPEIFLVVYETPQNPCSERGAIQTYFRENGVDIQEWTKKED